MSSVAADVEQFLAEEPAELEALRAAVSASGTDEILPLDLSYDSLDRIEEYFRRTLEASLPEDELTSVQDRVIRYVGATLASHTKGTWTIATSSMGPGFAIKVPGIKARPFFPRGPVLEFKRLRWLGFIRDATEKWDLPHRRAELAGLLAARDRELASLREDIEQLTGTRVVKLDSRPATIQLIEEALRKLHGPGVPRSRRREVQERVILLLGTLSAQARGVDDWKIVDDPKESEFGEIEVGNWSPARPVRYTTARLLSGHVWRNLELALKTSGPR